METRFPQDAKQPAQGDLAEALADHPNRGAVTEDRVCSAYGYGKNAFRSDWTRKRGPGGFARVNGKP